MTDNNSTTKPQSTTEPIEVPERIWIAPTTIKKREGRIYLAPGRKDNEIEYAHVHTSVQKNEGGEVGGSDIERPRQIFDAGFTAAASPLAVEQSDGWPSEAANKIADYFNAPPSVIPAIERIIQRCAVPAPSAAAQDEAVSVNVDVDEHGEIVFGPTTPSPTQARAAARAIARALERDEVPHHVEESEPFITAIIERCLSEGEA